MSETETITITFALNGRATSADVPATLPLISLLRERYELLGTKLACSRGVCGACTVLIDGKPAASCALFAFHADGAAVETIEGLSGDGLHPIQKAFQAKSAFQCGYCTSGMIMLTKALLDHEPNPARETIIDWISSNVCRCTGYSLIVEAVLDAAAELRRTGAAV